MESPVDLTLIVSWPQAFVAVVLVLALLVWPQIGSWLTGRQARDAARAAHEAITHEAKPNSGSSMKDSLNRIEAYVGEIRGEQASQAQRLAVLETLAEKRGGRRMWRRR